MARKKKQTKALAKYDKELAQYAQQYADQEAKVGGSTFFSLRNGELSFGGNQIPNNEMPVIILDAVLENAWNENPYDSEDRQPPGCYAFGRDEDDMKPHEECENPQSDACADCELNQFGTAERGRGKACKNRRRLALISAGEMTKAGEFEPTEDPEHLQREEVGLLLIPPTSIKGFATYVKTNAKALNKPPFGYYTLISVESDPDTQFKVNFELLGPVPEDLIPTVIEKHQAVKDEVVQPYPKKSDQPSKGGKTKRGSSKKKAKRSKPTKKTQPTRRRKKRNF